jgi:hypothetical protein
MWLEKVSTMKHSSGQVRGEEPHAPDVHSSTANRKAHKWFRAIEEKHRLNNVEYESTRSIPW